MSWKHGLRLAGLLFLLVGWLGAATSNWQGDDGTNPTHWDLAANWQGGIPAVGDNVLFSDNTGTGTDISLNGSPQTVANILFNIQRNVTILTGNALTITGGGLAVTGGTHVIACDLVLGADTIVSIDAGATLTITGGISGGFNLTKTGAGTLILAGINAYSGGTQVDDGTLSLTASGALNGTSGVVVNNTGILSLGGNIVLRSVAMGINSPSGSNLQNASGFNIWPGPITVTTNPLTVLSNAGTLVLGGTVGNGGGLLSCTGAGNLIVSGAISGAGGLTKLGTGVVTLAGANTYGGATLVSAGTLSAQHAQALGDSGAPTTTTVAADAALILDGSLAIGANETIQLNGDGGGGGALQVASGSPSLAGPLVLQSASTLTIISNASTLTVNGLLSGAFQFDFQGGGTLALNVANSANGGMSVTNGTVRLGAATALPGGAINLGGTLNLNGFSPTIAGAFTGGGAVTSAGAATVTFTGGGSWNGTFGGSAAVTVSAGTFILGGGATSNHSGDTTVSGTGTLTVNSSATVGSATSVKIGAGGTLALGNVSVSRPVAFTGAGTIAPASGATATLSGTLTGAAVINGLGTLSLPNATSFTSLSLSNATLQFGNVASLGSGPVTVNSGTLAPGSALSPTNAVTIAGNCTLGGSANATFATVTIDGTPTITVAGGLTHTLADVRQGTGSAIIIAGAGTLTADLTPGAGTAITTLTVQGGATWNTSSASVSLNALSGTGTVQVGSGTLTLTGTPTFAGAITGSGGLTVNSAGPVTLSGISTYTGTTTVTSGTLSLTGDTGAIASCGSLVVASGATFAISNAGGSANPNRLGDSLIVTMNGGTFAMTAPTNIDRTETIGELRFPSGASSIQLIAAGSGSCQLTCGSSPAGFSNVGGGTFSLAKTNGTSGMANLFSTNGFADGVTVSFATGGYTIYKTSVGLDALVSVTTTLAAGDWSNAANWDNGVPDATKTAVVTYAMTSGTSQVYAAKVQFASGGVSPGLAAQGLGGSYQLLTLPSGGEIEVLANVTATISGFSPYGSEGAVVLTTQTGGVLNLNEATVAGQPAATNIFYRNQLSLRGSGTGTINLNHANASIIANWPTLYTGPVAVTGGIVNLINASSIPSMNQANATMSAQPWSLDANALIDVNGNTCRVDALSGGGGRFTNTGAAATLNVTGATTNGGTLTGSIIGPLSLVVGNWLTVQGPGTCTYSGTTTVSSGTLTINKPVGVEGIGNGSVVTLSSGAGLTVNGDETIGGLSVSGSNTVTVAAGATLTAAGASTFGGTMSLAGGGTLALAPSADSSGTGIVTVSGSSTLRITRALHLGTAAGLTLNVGTLAAQGGLGALSLTQTISLAGNGMIEVGNGTTLTGAGLLGPGTLTKSGAGTLISGSTTCTQSATSVLAGVFQVSDYRHLGNAGLTLDGGTLGVTASLVATTGAGGTGSVRTLTVGAGGGTVDVAAGQTLTWPGQASGSGGLTKTSTGTLVLSANNAGFTGQLTVSSGIVRIDHAGALGGSASGTLVSDGASLQVNGAFALTEPMALVGDGGGVGALQLAAGSSLGTGVVQLSPGATTPATIAVAAGTATVSSRIRGSGGLDKIGAGTLVLSDLSSDFTGTASISAGMVQVADEASFGAAGNIVALNGGTLAVSAAVTFNASRALRVTLAGGTVSTGASTLSLPGLDTAAGQNLQLTGAGGVIVNTANGVTSTIAGSLYGAGSLTKSGLGTLTLQSANDGIGANPSYTGVIAVNTGQLRVNGSVAASSMCTVLTTGLLSGNGTLGALTVDGTIRPGGVLAAGVLTSASLTINATAVLDFDLGTANDLLSVSGVASVANGAQVLVAGLPNAAAFGVGDYTIIAAGSAWTYTPGDLSVTYTGGITGGTAANYRLVDGGTSLVLQRNRAPQVTTGVDTTPGTTSTSTTPPSYTVGPPGSTALFDALVGSGPANKLVQAVDPEGVATSAQLVFSLQLDPSQGRIDWFNGGAWVQVSSDSAVSLISTWTQADIDAGHVRYLSTGAVGGNDAILYSCSDNLGAESPLYLMRFTIQGSGPPVLGGLPATALWQEEAIKPGPWSALAPAATISAGVDPLDGGQLKVSLLNGESGDELGFNGNGVSVAGDGTVFLSGVLIGSLVATTTSLTVTLNANVTQARTTALLQSASFRTSNPAPQASGRSIELRASDGSIAGGTTIVAFPLVVDLYNDAPTLALTIDVNGSPLTASAVAAIPGLARTGQVVPSDAEGESGANITMVLTQNALQGALVFNANGAFSYTPFFLPAGLQSDVLTDSFTVTVTDADFTVNPSATRVDGIGDPVRYNAASRQVVVPIRIAASGTGLAFLNMPRLTVDNATSGSFSYTPQMQLPSGVGTVSFELVDVPAGVTLGAGSGQINFNPSSGAINWPAVPAPAGALPQYWRFGILATDPTTGSAALLPIMLRVGPGGTNG